MRTFVVLVLAYMLSQFYRAFLAVVAADLSRDLNLDSEGLGLLLSAWFGAFAAAQLPVGMALDRFGPRRTLSAGLCSAVVGATGLAFSTGLFGASVAMGLIGAGCAPVLMAGYYLIARTYPLAQFATMSSLLLGLGSLGDPLSGMPLALAVQAFGWRAAVCGVAALTALGAAATTLLIRDPPRAENPIGTSRLGSIVRVMAMRQLWPLLPLALVGYAFVASTRGIWITPYLERVHGLSATSSSVAATVMGLCMAAGALLYAPLNGLLGGPKRTVAAGVGLTVLLWLALGLVGERSLPLALGLLMSAAWFGAPFALLMAHARSFMPEHLLGVGITFMNIVFMGGVSLGQWIAGRYVNEAERAGIPADILYGRMFTTFGLVLLASILAYALSPRERRS